MSGGAAPDPQQSDTEVVADVSDDELDEVAGGLPPGRSGGPGSNTPHGHSNPGDNNGVGYVGP